ncbi:MAG: PadR family transcriptional regulator [Candidatus Heimdallarchaeota archaeon]|nr:PadR family transcriptional regulator [Candidatus Heimdallarchaeota archaeon]
MFRGKALDAIILSILNIHPEGITGYALVKEIASTFRPMITPGTGTIYPRLKKLVESKDIQETENKKYKILDQGRQKINKNLHDFLGRSLEFLPTFYRFFSVDGIGASSCTTTVDSLEKLNKWKGRLEQTKIDLKEQYAEMQKNIDAKIVKIEKKIEEVNLKKSSWTKIAIEDED